MVIVDKIMKIVMVAPKLALSALGIAQVVVKFVKEICTLCVNVLYPVIPSEKFKEVVEKVRAIVDVADKWIEKGKDFLLKIGG